MRKWLLFITMLVSIMSLSACSTVNKQTVRTTQTKSTDPGANKPIVAVSIVPEATFVHKVAGDLVDVVTLVPPGDDPEDYAPTPQIMEQFSQAQLYFSIGVPTEKTNILPKASLNKHLQMVNLAQAASQQYPERQFSDGSRDPHVWMSPKRAVVMVQTISDRLSAIDPVHKATYQKNAAQYIKKLKALDQNIQQKLKNLKQRTFIVYHPAFGYFAEEFGLHMISLEVEGKDATPQHLQQVIDDAKKQNIKVIFYQAEISSKQAQEFANELNGKAIQVSPLAPDYINNLKTVANTFAQGMGK